MEVPTFARLGLTVPLIAAPMAGVSTPELAAAVSNAGGLGSIAVGATDANGARAMIAEVRERTSRAFNVNLFAHAPPPRDVQREAAWLAFLRPYFADFGAEPPLSLRPAYPSFAEDASVLDAVIDAAPSAVSFHFGLPPAEVVTALKQRGVLLLATATSRDEARAAAAAGIDVIVAQGIEAGGHRGMFDPAADDDALTTLALTRLLVRDARLPVVAAGGVMDGAGIAAALALGAAAAQLGTAFIVCPESAADEAYHAALAGPGADHTAMTSAISGRPARALANRFTALESAPPPPAYPVAYDAGKALHAAAKAHGEHGFAAHWAGQGAPLARALPAAELVETLRRELEHARVARPGELMGASKGAS